MLTLEEQKEEFLAHAGVKGMEWGKTKTTTGYDGPAKAAPTLKKALILGSYGSKSRYTDPKAIEFRKKAGALRIAAIVTSAAGTGITVLGSSSSDPSVRLGARAVDNLLSTAASGVYLGSLGTAARGIVTEQNSRS